MVKKIIFFAKHTIKMMDIKKFIKFSFVGVINTIVFYVIYFILLQLDFSYVVSLTVGTIAGIINSFLWNKFYTFKSKKLSLSETLKFLAVAGVQYVVNLAVVHICVSYIGISAELAGIIAICISVFVSYFGHKFWTFKERL